MIVGHEDLKWIDKTRYSELEWVIVKGSYLKFKKEDMARNLRGLERLKTIKIVDSSDSTREEQLNKYFAEQLSSKES